jgi:hypothetical protein
LSISGIGETYSAFGGRINAIAETEVADLSTGPVDLVGHLAEVAFQFWFKPLKLRPVSFQTDTEQTNAERVGF